MSASEDHSATIAVLHRVLGMLKDDAEQDVRMVSVFQSIGIRIQAGANTADDALAGRLRSDYNALMDDTSNLLTVLARLSWDLEQRDTRKLPEGLWMHFSRLDAESFFVLMRSAADHVGGMLAELSRAPQSTPRSLGDLRKQAKNPERDNLGDDVKRTVLSCAWFDQFKEWREHVVHFGGLTLTFPVKGRLLFQIYGGAASKVQVPGIMYNENVVDLGSFITVYLANLFALVEDVSLLIQKRLQVPMMTGWRNHPALSLLRSGLQQLEAELRVSRAE